MPHPDLPAKACPLVIDPHDTEAINQWLTSVRLDAPLTQPTAFRLAQVLAAQKPPAISLTPDVRQRLGLDPAVCCRPGSSCAWAAGPRWIRPSPVWSNPASSCVWREAATRLPWPAASAAVRRHLGTWSKRWRRARAKP